jgi:hypothetical protein
MAHTLALDGQVLIPQMASHPQRSHHAHTRCGTHKMVATWDVLRGGRCACCSPPHGFAQLLRVIHRPGPAQPCPGPSPGAGLSTRAGVHLLPCPVLLDVGAFSGRVVEAGRSQLQQLVQLSNSRLCAAFGVWCACLWLRPCCRLAGRHGHATWVLGVCN